VAHGAFVFSRISGSESPYVQGRFCFGGVRRGMNKRTSQTRGRARAQGKAKAKTNAKTKRTDKEGATEKGPERTAGERLQPVDFVEVPKDIAVEGAAKNILAAVIEQAMGGQLGAAKYLFEAVGLYPTSAETASAPEGSLAYTLLRRLGLPTDPWIVTKMEVRLRLIVRESWPFGGSLAANSESANRRPSTKQSRRHDKTKIKGMP